MTMQPGNLLSFTKGGGGLIGKGKTCRLDNFKIVAHSLEKKDKTTGAVLERYPVATFCQFDINVLDQNVEDDKRHGLQYLRVGRVPLWYANQVNSIDPQRDANYPGGFLPSVDNQNPSTEGPFILFVDENGIWEGEDYSVFIQEFVRLGFLDQGGADRMAKAGVACLNGVVVKLDEKSKQKGKKSDPAKAARTVLAPVQIVQWPWQSAPNQIAAPPQIAAPASAPASIAPPVQTSIAVPAPSSVIVAPGAAAVASPAPGGNGANYDQLAIDTIKQLARNAGGMVKSSDLLTLAFPATGSLDGPTRSQVMSRINTPAFVQGAAAAGHFLVDPSGTIMVTG